MRACTAGGKAAGLRTVFAENERAPERASGVVDRAVGTK
jgi:hypothetical protein